MVFTSHRPSLLPSLAVCEPTGSSPLPPGAMLCSITTTQTTCIRGVEVGRLSWKGCRCRLSPTSSPPSTGSNLGPSVKKSPHSPSSSFANLALRGRPDKEEENGSWLLFP